MEAIVYLPFLRIVNYLGLKENYQKFIFIIIDIVFLISVFKLNWTIGTGYLIYTIFNEFKYSRTELFVLFITTIATRVISLEENFLAISLTGFLICGLIYSQSEKNITKISLLSVFFFGIGINIFLSSFRLDFYDTIWPLYKCLVFGIIILLLVSNKFKAYNVVLLFLILNLNITNLTVSFDKTFIVFFMSSFMFFCLLLSYFSGREKKSLAYFCSLAFSLSLFKDIGLMEMSGLAEGSLILGLFLSGFFPRHGNNDSKLHALLPYFFLMSIILVGFSGINLNLSSLNQTWNIIFLMAPLYLLILLNLNDKIEGPSVKMT